MKTHKISIIGAGFVGSTTAFALMNHNLASEIVIVDINNSQKQMTLKFTDLKMSNGQISYTFDGTIKHRSY